MVESRAYVICGWPLICLAYCYWPVAFILFSLLVLSKQGMFIILGIGIYFHSESGAPSGARLQNMLNCFSNLFNNCYWPVAFILFSLLMLSKQGMFICRESFYFLYWCWVSRVCLFSEQDYSRFSGLPPWSNLIHRHIYFSQQVNTLNLQGMFIFTVRRAPPVAPDYSQFPVLH